MTEWKDVLTDIVNALGSDPATLPCVLDFLRVLPEEVTHGRKIALTVRPADPQPTFSFGTFLRSRHMISVLESNDWWPGTRIDYEDGRIDRGQRRTGLEAPCRVCYFVAYVNPFFCLCLN